MTFHHPSPTAKRGNGETDPDPWAGGLRRRIGAALLHEESLLPYLVTQEQLYLS